MANPISAPFTATSDVNESIPYVFELTGLNGSNNQNKNIDV
jgi:hypothetical protein